MQTIVLASNNQGKIREFNAIFNDLGINIISQSEFNVPEVDEPYHTFLENALHKARHCAKYTKLPSLADDSGICVNSLNGAPGVFSARFAGEPKSDERNNQLLIEKLKNIKDKSAFYYCVLVFVKSEDDPRPLVADGSISGTIVDVACGNNGFGYDPHFYLTQFNKTVAELTNIEKNQISHRRIATNNLITKIKEYV